MVPFGNQPIPTQKFQVNATLGGVHFGEEVKESG
jgi:hypothetical protein